MYKIYINEKPLLLMKTSDLKGLPPDLDYTLTSRYAGRSKFLLHHIDQLEKTKDPRAIIVYSDDLDALWDDFKNLFYVIKAAGGLVYNPNGKVLAIFRRNFWDLPKGKIDKGERKKQAAIREVMEETGIKNVVIEHKLTTTWHTYRDKNKGNQRVLKKTFWYRMSTSEQDLIPQVEEDIEKAVWVEPLDLKEAKPIYKSILEVLSC